MGWGAHVQRVVASARVDVVRLLYRNDFHFQVVDLVVFVLHFLLRLYQLVAESFDLHAHFRVDLSLVRQFLKQFLNHDLHLALNLFVEPVVL